LNGKSFQFGTSRNSAGDRRSFEHFHKGLQVKAFPTNSSAAPRSDGPENGLMSERRMTFAQWM
jgi:hypothetical protein